MHKLLYCTCVKHCTAPWCTMFDSLVLCCCKAFSTFMRRNAGNMPFSWLPCQLSAYGVVDCVTDFFSEQTAHTLDPLSSEPCQGRFHCSFTHLRQSKHGVSCWSVCVCVCLLCVSLSHGLQYGAKVAELELYTDCPKGGAEWGRKKKLGINMSRIFSQFIFAWLIQPSRCVFAKQSALMVKNGRHSFLGSHMFLAVCYAVFRFYSC